MTLIFTAKSKRNQSPRSVMGVVGQSGSGLTMDTVIAVLKKESMAGIFNERSELWRIKEFSSMRH